MSTQAVNVFIFLFLHWYLSVFFQSFFLHRYGAHKMFTMHPFWEKLFYLLTFVTQGSSFLNPRAYAILHRRHHAYSDTPQDPHSPLYSSSPWKMMIKTFVDYQNILHRAEEFPKEKDSWWPEWKGFDEWARSQKVRISFIFIYIGMYAWLEAALWMYVLIPIHVLMGPIHGAIVNWCGHKYGYQNFDNQDQSRNTMPIDVVCVGELMQNNHHRNAQKPNFASRWFEFDMTYAVMRLFSALKIIQFKKEPVRV